MNRKTLFVDRRNGFISSEDEICRGFVDGLVEGRIGMQMRSEEVLNGGGIIRENVLCAMLR